jgi:hypothetical protein
MNPIRNDRAGKRNPNPNLQHWRELVIHSQPFRRCFHIAPFTSRLLSARQRLPTWALCFLSAGLAAALRCTRQRDDAPTSFAEEKLAIWLLISRSRILMGNRFICETIREFAQFFLEFGSCTCVLYTSSGLDRLKSWRETTRTASSSGWLLPGSPPGSMAMTHGPNPRQTKTSQERAERARTFRAQQKISRRILVDEFGDQSVQWAFGDRDNQVIVVDISGRIAMKLAQTNTNELDTFLQQHCR